MGTLAYCLRCGRIYGDPHYRGEKPRTWCDCKSDIPFYNLNEKKKVVVVQTNIELADWHKEYPNEPLNAFGTPRSVYFYVWENFVDIPENENLNRVAFEEYKAGMIHYFNTRGTFPELYDSFSSAPVTCPVCGSTSISTQKKGFGVGKAAAGAVVAGPIGIAAGGIGANKVYNICQKCGHQWTPGNK